MCGIAGIYNLDNAPANEANLKIMAEIQAHRGPDDFGLWLDNAIGFSHRRLSIIDLSEHAHQPMISADGNLILVYNGEIYNYLEIKEELKSKGYNFHSNSDSEVLLYSFQEWGKNCVSKFNGMWAFAIYNKKEEMLFCSRDRFGVKPFYYFYNKKSFTFSSEIKALLAILPELRHVNYTYLYYFLTTSSLDDGEETFFKSIKTLKPAHNLLIKKDQFKIWKYWDYEENFKSKYDYNHPEDSFLDLLKSSVQFRLRSDVPVGTCLSGGLDSSSIVTIMHKSFGIKVHTFSSMYEDKDCDESYYINLIKDYCNCQSNFIYPQPDNFLENLLKIIYYQDEPTLGPGLYSQWHVMQLAKNKVKVLLDGQGGDELLGGYFYYFSAYLSTLLDLGKSSKLSYALKIIKEYPQIKALTKENYNEGLIEMLRSLFLPRFFNNLLRMPKINFKKNKKMSIYNPEFENLFFKEPLARKKEVKFKDKLNDLLYWSLTKTSIPALLRYEDRNSMAFSIEARTPFLDYRLAEFCLGLPYELKIKGHTTKVIMRESLKGILPSEIVNRRDKKGYPTPFSRWLREGLGKSIEEILFSKPYFLPEILNLKELKSRFEKHLALKNDYSWEIWRYLNLELWYQMFILRKIKL